MPELADFASILLTRVSPTLAAAIQSATLPGLADGPQNDELAKILSSPDLANHFVDHPSRQNELISGLWLLAGDLDRSHTISQDLPSSEGSFLHGIMHRREGDFGNAKYWFRRVGEHPVIDQIAQTAGHSYVDPFEFVDACSDAVRQTSSGHRDRISASDCQAIQWIEWQCLMAHLC